MDEACVFKMCCVWVEFHWIEILLLNEYTVIGLKSPKDTWSYTSVHAP